MPLIRREVDEVNEQIFAEVTFHAAYEPQRAIRTRRWKYIRRFDDEHAGPVLPNTDDSPTKDVLLRHGWKDQPVAREQLYDLVFDPERGGESRRRPGVRGRPRRPARAPRDWMRATDDPLLDGPVEPIAGALLNDRDQVSAAEPMAEMAPSG